MFFIKLRELDPAEYACLLDLFEKVYCNDTCTIGWFRSHLLFGLFCCYQFGFWWSWFGQIVSQFNKWTFIVLIILWFLFYLILGVVCKANENVFKCIRNDFTMVVLLLLLRLTIFSDNWVMIIIRFVSTYAKLIGVGVEIFYRIECQSLIQRLLLGESYS